jgi:glycosyltransferase involved in cell wall biosynthesis
VTDGPQIGRLVAEIERQRKLIEELNRPRHWTQQGQRGAKATALHNKLDRLLEALVGVRNSLRRRPRLEPEAVSSLILQPIDAAAGEQQPDPANDVDHDQFPTTTYDGFDDRCARLADALLTTAKERAGQGTVERTAWSHVKSVIDHLGADAPYVAWSCLCATLGMYPTYVQFEDAHRIGRLEGPLSLAEHLRGIRTSQLESMGPIARPLLVVADAILIDLTHTARHDLHTGIQRVVRETGQRWLRQPGAVGVWWDQEGTCLRALGAYETQRFLDWRDHLPESTGTEPVVHDFDDRTPSAMVLPHHNIFVLPEIAADPRRTGHYRAMLAAKAFHRFGAIGYDLVPVTAAETVADGMAGVFNAHLSLVKHANYMSAISASAAKEFISLWGALEAQGLASPHVEAHLLPSSPPVLSESAASEALSSLNLTDLPIILAVGSREPRKNQLALLEACRMLQASDTPFQLVMVGGSGWNSDGIDREIERTRALGIEITVRTRATEAELFALYGAATVTAFPSIYEGFGLPIVESLALGTPVVTSNFGAMAEVGSGGGALMVSPTDPRELANALRTVLTDGAQRQRLIEEASSRDFGTWQGYASDVWRHLVGRELQ